MSEATAHRTRQVRVASINVAQRLRPLRDSLVDELAESIAARGLISPISITHPNGQVSPVLVAGAHRLEAAKRLRWETIPCIEVPYVSADQITLIEVDENLIRGDLSPAERAIHIGRRKEIYEALHPETKAGTNQHKKSRSQNGTGTPSDSFLDATAATTGKGRSTVARDAHRAANIPALSDVVGTSLDQGDELDALAKLTEARQADLIGRAAGGERVTAKSEAKRAARAAKEQALGEATRAASVAIGEKRYGVIYADPPWRFEPYCRETGLDRAADNHYPTMSIEEICSLDIPAADNCVLFLWATVPMLREALSVMSAWGFAYKSHCVWVKDRIGTGYWFRNGHEVLLVGTRGKVPAPAPGQQFNSFIDAPVGEHSSKPAAFAEMIEELFPNAALLEMFARAPRLGWDVWGNEVTVV